MKIDDKLLTKNQRWIRSNKLVALSTLLIKDSYCEWVFKMGFILKCTSIGFKRVWAIDRQDRCGLIFIVMLRNQNLPSSTVRI